MSHLALRHCPLGRFKTTHGVTTRKSGLIVSFVSVCERGGMLETSPQHAQHLDEGVPQKEKMHRRRRQAEGEDVFE